ncbi:MAG: iron-containing alcohol dehydrogenase [Candidatus Poribacteria bacterium]|nr:iron-containing alcohol dehydrogenase [Candidatus Poribacteria bacterium]
MEVFDSEFTQRVIYGENSIDKLAEATTTLGGSRILIVSDPGIDEAGILNRAYSSLNSEKIPCYVFTNVDPNPTTKHVNAALEFAKANTPIDLIIGLGGGSAMDCAKGTNFLLTNGGKMEDYWGTSKATKPMLPSIGIPTTIGTGSEAQSFALIAQEETHIKMACGDKKAQFETVILDPTLTETLPRSVAAITGIDAIAHAIESYVSTRRNPMSQMFSLHAWRMLNSYYKMALEAKNVDARGKMLFGAYLAGLAIENSMLGAAHACANPLTTRYGITHGVAVALMLPHVIRLNKIVAGDGYNELYPDGNLADRIETLMNAGDLPNTIRQCDVQHAAKTTDITILAKEAATQWTAQFNPRSLGIHDFVRLYEQVY